MANTPEKTEAKQEHPLTVLQGQIEGERMAAQLEIALPEHMSVKKFQRVLVTAVSKNPDLLDADRQSLFTATVDCATDGLLPNGREAALVVYNTKVKRGGQEVWIKNVQYMPMVGGIYKKARNSGEITMLDAHLVYAKDKFDYALGLEPRCEHVPFLASGADRGAVIGVYGVCKLTDGTPYIEVMSVDEVNHIRESSKNPNGGPWAKHWGEMARKTVIHRLSKRLPLSSDMEKLIQNVEKMYDFEKIAGEPPTDRPKLADFSNEEPAGPVPPKEEAATYSFADETGEVVFETTDADEYRAKFEGAVAAASTFKALEALADGNESTIFGLDADSIQSCGALVTARHEAIRAEYDKRKAPKEENEPANSDADREPAAEGKAGEQEPEPEQEAPPRPYVVVDSINEVIEVGKVENLMAVIEKVTKESAPENLPKLFDANVALMGRLSEEGMDKMVEYFEKACEPKAEERPEPPEEEAPPAEEQAEEAPQDAGAYFVQLQMRQNGKDENWSGYATSITKIIRENPAAELDTIEGVNQDGLDSCSKKAPNWFKSIQRAIEEKRAAG